MCVIHVQMNVCLFCDPSCWSDYVCIILCLINVMVFITWLSWPCMVVEWVNCAITHAWRICEDWLCIHSWSVSNTWQHPLQSHLDICCWNIKRFLHKYVELSLCSLSWKRPSILCGRKLFLQIWKYWQLWKQYMVYEWSLVWFGRVPTWEHLLPSWWALVHNYTEPGHKWWPGSQVVHLWWS